MVFVTGWADIIGGEEPGRAEAVVHLAQVGRTGQDIVVRIGRIVAKRIARTQFGIRVGHDLHQPDCSLWRDGFDVAAAFDTHHATYPCYRDCETFRGLADALGPWSQFVGEARSEEHTSELQSHSDLVC